MRTSRRGVAALSVMSLAVGFVATRAQAATLYFDNNGTGSGYGTSTNGSYSWDGSVWASASGGTSATTTWTQNSTADFLATSTTYTVNASNDEQVAGVTDGETTTGDTTIIGQASGHPSGQLDIGSSSVSFTISTTGSTLDVTAPIVGTGMVVQHGNGTLDLFGPNTFSGGFEVTGGQFTYFNSTASFGAGAITVAGSAQALLSSGSAGLNIPNNFVFPTAGYALNLVGAIGTITNPGTIFSGKFPLPSTGTTNIETSSTVGVVDEISGLISGSSSLEVSDKGTLIVNAPNTYTGTTTVSSAVNAAATLVLGAANTIAKSSELILAGANLNPDGFDQNMSLTTLDLTTTANSTVSTIDFSAGGSELDFADSHALTWTGTLNLANFDFGDDHVRIGTTANGLTSAQLADIEFNGNASTLGTAKLDANGYLVPEPTSLSLLGIGAFGLVARRRKNACK